MLYFNKKILSFRTLGHVYFNNCVFLLNTASYNSCGYPLIDNRIDEVSNKPIQAVNDKLTYR